MRIPVVMTLLALGLTACQGGEVGDDPALLALIDRVDALEAENATLRQDLEAADAALRADLDAVAEQAVVQIIDTDTTVAVPGDHATLAEAMAWLDGYQIASTAGVTIQLADGQHDLAETLRFNHANGARIEVIGNVTDPSAVILAYGGSDRALRVRGGVLAWMDGVTIRGTGDAGSIGVEAADGGSFSLGPNVVVERFGRSGIRATRGGVVYAEGVEVRDNVGHGFWASHAGYIAAWDASASGNGGNGIFGVAGGVVSAGGAVSSGNGAAGFAAHAGVVTAEQSTSGNNGGAGYEAFSGGTIGAWESTAVDNAGQGYEAGTGGVIEAAASTSSANGANGYLATFGGVVQAEGAVASSNGESGMHAAWNSVVLGRDSAARGNTWSGYAAFNNASIHAEGAQAENGDEGFTSFGMSYVDVSGGDATNNTGLGFSAQQGSWLVANGVTMSGNGGIWSWGPYSSSSPLPTEADWGVIWAAE